MLLLWIPGAKLDWVQCDSCESWYHLLCVELVKLPDEDEEYICKTCTSRIEKSNKNDKRLHNNKTYKMGSSSKQEKTGSSSNDAFQSKISFSDAISKSQLPKKKLILGHEKSATPTKPSINKESKTQTRVSPSDEDSDVSSCSNFNRDGLHGKKQKKEKMHKKPTGDRSNRSRKTLSSSSSSSSFSSPTIQASGIKKPPHSNKLKDDVESDDSDSDISNKIKKDLDNYIYTPWLK